MTFEEFILSHEGDDPASLVLSRSKYPEIDMTLAASTLRCRARMKSKVPQWYKVAGIVYPNSLCAEQCSSSVTAFYKADLCRRILKGRENVTIADLTGGLGVDSWAFSGVAQRVIYNEMNPVLCHHVEENFRKLGLYNVTVSCSEVVPGAVSSIVPSADLIFLDPARRSSTGSKVFLLEDCSPNVLELTAELMACAPNILIKLSPMADIAMIASRLGSNVREIHVVGDGGECKELLVWMDREWTGDYSIHVGDFSFTLLQEREAMAMMLNEEGLDKIKSGILFEPSKALAKSGAFNLLSQRFSLLKAGRSTHLYFTDNGDYERLEGYGKIFRIHDVFPLGKAGFKACAAAYPNSEVSSRNVPMSSDELRKRLKVSPSNNYHIFGCHLDAGGGSNVLLACERLYLKK